MRRLLAIPALMAVVLLVPATSALASGVNLSWDDCGIHGTVNKAFACNTNTFEGVIIGSFQPTYGPFELTALSARVDLKSGGSALPDWWQFKNARSCRQTALAASASFTTGTYSCEDPWLGQAAGGLASYSPNRWNDPRAVHMDIIFALPSTMPTHIESPNEYLGFMLKISGAKTVGTGACPGCATPVCIVWNWLGLSGTNSTYIHTSYTLDHNYVTWQGGTVVGGCPAATPASNRTWGSLKSLYN